MDPRRSSSARRCARSIAVVIALVAATTASAQNYLILVADDVGIDKVGYTNEGPGDVGAVSVPKTPNIDALAYGGLAFRNAYSHVVCSSTRAALQTGRHPGRTGIGNIVHPNDPAGFGLQRTEITLPEMLELDPSVPSHASGLFGKWHLGTPLNGGPLAPNVAGYDRAEFVLGNLPMGGQSYYSFDVVVDGHMTHVQAYATTETVDRALAWLQSAPEPWLAVVAFNAPHSPWHAPPWPLHQSFLPFGLLPRQAIVEHYGAAVTAMDTEIGRLLDGLASLRDRTDVFFLGDNGTPKKAAVPPFLPSHAKLSPYDGAVHVPFIVNGPSVVQPGRETDGLVSVNDVFATVAELAGVDLALHYPPASTLDSTSLVPYLVDPEAPSVRSSVYAEFFDPLGAPQAATKHWQLIRDERYRLIHVIGPGGTQQQLFDLWLDPFEETDLLAGPLTPAEQQSYLSLDAQRAAIVASY